MKDPLLSKISRKDFDVIDAFGKTFELVFPATGKNRELSLTARVEGKRISEMPFQFPSENFYQKMSLKAKFYTFRLREEKGHTNATDEMRQISLKPAFFKEFSPTGSGHPSGFTYGWVTNDEKNLYVKMDFTPDNTMDGDKDYAKVYVRTANGLKEFRVSQSSTVWGRPDFTYTDKVPYQHKVYSFEIPLKEIGIERTKKEIQLAFAAYGTAAPGNTATGMAYDPENNRHLAVFMTGGGSSVIFGQFMDCSGSPIGSAFPISSKARYEFLPLQSHMIRQTMCISWHGKKISAAIGISSVSE